MIMCIGWKCEILLAKKDIMWYNQIEKLRRMRRKYAVERCADDSKRQIFAADNRLYVGWAD